VLSRVLTSADCIPLGRAVLRRNVTDAPHLPPLSVYLDAGIVPRSTRNDNHNRLGADLSKYLVVEPGDLVFNKLRTWQGGLGVSRYRGIVSPAYFVCSPTAEFESRFLHYLLRSSPYLAEFSRISKFMPPSQFDITWDDLRVVPVQRWRRGLQRAIADFLDTETARIDALITKKRRLIELLEERMRAAVTRWISASARLPLKRLVRFQEGPGIMAADFQDEGVPLIRVAGVGSEYVTLRGCNYLDPVLVRSRWSHFALDPGDYVISASASMGIVSRVGSEAAGAIPYTGLIRFKPAAREVDMEYVRYFLRSDDFMSQIDQMKRGTAIQHFGPTHLDQVSIPYLPVPEQRASVSAVAKVELMTRHLRELLHRQLILLQEHRQALITAAVTGELDIPCVAA